MKKIIILLFATTFGFVSNGFSQKIFETENTGKKGVIYDEEFSVDFRLQTNGFMVAGNFGKIKTYYKTRIYQIEIGEIKHPKEVRQSLNSPRSFIYGKHHTFYTLHAGYGMKRYFSEKANKKGLSVGMSYVIGPTLGVLKPYYLDIYPENPQIQKPVPQAFSSKNEAFFLSPGRIYGASGFSYGWGELSVVPGLRAKAGLHLDWGAFERIVKALDAGIMLDVYSTKVPIMVSNEVATSVQGNKNSFYFVNLYISFQLGKRW